MEFNKAFDDKQNKLLDDQSKGPGLYQLDHSLKNNLPVYPWAPGTNVTIDKNGINRDVVDAHSEFLVPSSYGDMIDVKSLVSEWRDKTLITSHEIHNRG